MPLPATKPKTRQPTKCRNRAPVCLQRIGIKEEDRQFANAPSAHPLIPKILHIQITAQQKSSQ